MQTVWRNGLRAPDALTAHHAGVGLAYFLAGSTPWRRLREARGPVMKYEAENRVVAADLAEPRIVDRTITDLASFQENATGTRAVAGLYGLMKLDVLVEAARAVALDFFARPEIGDLSRSIRGGGCSRTCRAPCPVWAP